VARGYPTGAKVAAAATQNQAEHNTNEATRCSIAAATFLQTCCSRNAGHWQPGLKFEAFNGVLPF